MSRRIRENPNGTAAPAQLYSGPITMGDAGVTRPGSLSLLWEPEPRLEFRIEGEEDFDEALLSDNSWEASGVPLTLANGRRCVAHPNRWEYWEDREAVRGNIDPCSFGAARVRRIQAQIVNLPVANPAAQNPRVTQMVGNGWRLRLRHRASGDPDARVFFITGSLLVEREDGEDFDPELAVSLLEGFDHFATLAQGAWATHALPIGLSSRGRIVWERWVVGRVDRSGTGDGWATQYSENAAVLAAMWPGFIAKWEDPDWQPTLRTLATLLAEATAHTSGEAALLIVDVVLELLSWAVVVRSATMVSSEGHDRLQGPDRLRLLLSVSGLDRRLPDRLHQLRDAAHRRGWIDGPHAIADIRDAIVHPRRRERLGSLSDRAIDEAQLLARDYAHGALARFFGATAWKPWTDRWLEADPTSVPDGA